jgi:hypothetical protein
MVSKSIIHARINIFFTFVPARVCVQCSRENEDTTTAWVPAALQFRCNDRFVPLHLITCNDTCCLHLFLRPDLDYNLDLEELMSTAWPPRHLRAFDTDLSPQTACI